MSALLIFTAGIPCHVLQLSAEEAGERGERTREIASRGQEQLFERLSFLEELAKAEEDDIPEETAELLEKYCLYSERMYENICGSYAPDSPEKAWEYEEDVSEAEDWNSEISEAEDWNSELPEGTASRDPQDGDTKIYTVSEQEIRWGAHRLEDGTGSLYLLSFEGSSQPVCVEIPEKVWGLEISELEESCFTGMQDVLAKAVLPDTLQKIGAGAFRGCRLLRHIHLPDSVKEIGDGAFAETGIHWFSGLSDNPVFETRDGVIFERAEGKLTAYPAASVRSTYTIPEGIKTIQKGAFDGCTCLEKCTLAASVKELPAGAFEGSSICDLLTAEGQTVYESINGVLLRRSVNGEADVLAVYPPGKKQVTYSVRKNIRSIDDQAFAGASCLRQVFLPEGLTRIGSGAFAGCTSLERISVPESVLDLGWYAFSGCTSLKKASLPASLQVLEEGVFYGCDSLEELEIPAGCIVLETLPEGVRIRENVSVTERTYGAEQNF